MKQTSVRLVLLGLGLLLTNVLYNSCGAKSLIADFVPENKTGNSDREMQENLFPVGINNPMNYFITDPGSQSCLKDKSAGGASEIQDAPTYVERHIEFEALKGCLPKGTALLSDLRNRLGVNIVSQHFPRRYCQDDCNGKNNLTESKNKPYFGLEADEHRSQEITLQAYLNSKNFYFWAAVEPSSEKNFPGDIKIIDADRRPYLPNSEAGIKEWRNWLNALFDYLDQHKATPNLRYLQIGNESDADYRKNAKANPANMQDYHWLAYARLVEQSYEIIRRRAPHVKIVAGAMATASIAIEGFHRPVLRYLSGQIDENGNSVAQAVRRCGGSACFDLFDYHSFTNFQEYKQFTACKPRNCLPNDDFPQVVKLDKSPQSFNLLLRESGLSDKKLVSQQGGTYTGQDSKANNMLLYQTEEDQAAYLLKKSIHSRAGGLEVSMSGTYIEHYEFNGTLHNWFTAMGLIYNGIPNVADCDGQFPCPDPGEGVKKLSWFALKKFIAMLSSSEWEGITTIESNRDDVLIYKIPQVKSQKIIYAVWWDWWHICPRPDETKAAYDETCLAAKSPKIDLDLGQYSGRVKVTRALPRLNSGQEATGQDFGDLFETEDISTESKSLKFILNRKPVYIETLP